jgi:hypothetical protein
VKLKTEENVKIEPFPFHTKYISSLTRFELQDISLLGVDGILYRGKYSIENPLVTNKIEISYWKDTKQNWPIGKTKLFHNSDYTLIFTQKKKKTENEIEKLGKRDKSGLCVYRNGLKNLKITNKNVHFFLSSKTCRFKIKNNYFYFTK